MIPAKIELALDQKAIQQHVEKQLNDCIQSTLWFVDVKRISALTCISVRALEEDFLSDPRMMAIQLRKNRKRYYPAQKALEVLTEILSE